MQLVVILSGTKDLVQRKGRDSFRLGGSSGEDAEFIISQTKRFFTPLRMTEEGIRMIYLNIRMTVAKGSE